MESQEMLYRFGLIGLVIFLSFHAASSCDNCRCEPCTDSRFWTVWTKWSDCDALNCVNGTRNRTRRYEYLFACGNCAYETQQEVCQVISHNCEHSCDASTGTCSCSNGYYLQKDRTTCAVKDYCIVNNNGGCNQICYNKRDGFECRCFGKYFLDSDQKTCLPYRCQQIQSNRCPSDSYGDNFGSVCASVSLTCTNRTAINGRCFLRCKDGYGLAIISPSPNEMFGHNFKTIDFSVINGTNCVYNVDKMEAMWDVNRTLLESYHCRRLNDPPWNLTLSNSAILEHSALYENIGVLSVIDDKNQQIVFTVENSEGVRNFRVRNGILQNTRSFALRNLQYRDTIGVVIRATDNGNPIMFSEKLFTIKVLNINEPPTGVKISRNIVTDLSSLGTVVGHFSAVDPDHSPVVRLSDDFNWTLTESGGHFKIEGNNLTFVKKFKRTGDFLYTVKVQCTDFGEPPLSVIKDIIIQYKDSNFHPVNLTVEVVRLLEGIAVNSKVGKIIAFDNEDDLISFIDMSSEVVKETFQINSTECNSIVDTEGTNRKKCFADIILLKKLDYESKNTYIFKIKASDEKGAVIFKEFMFDVVDMNDAPYNISIQFNTIYKGSPVGSLAGEIDVYDDDSNAKHTCEIINSVPFYFRGLNLIIKESIDTDFTPNEYHVHIKCIDNGEPPLSVTKTVIIHVTECPPGSSIFNCLVDPCQVSACSLYPTANCRANYCGGCHADFYVTGKKVNCACPALFDFVNSKCYCKNGLNGSACDRNESLCVDTKCPEGTLCSTFLNSPGRCVGEEFQFAILLRKPYSQYTSSNYRYKLEDHIKSIYAESKTFSLRKRRSVNPEVYIEAAFATKVVTTVIDYTFIKFIPYVKSKEKYTFMAGSNVCEQLVGRDISCVDERDCEILMSAGISCSRENLKQFVIGKRVGNKSKRGASDNMIVGVVVAIILVISFVIIVALYLHNRSRRRTTFVQQCSTDSQTVIIGDGGNETVPNVDIISENNNISIINNLRDNLNLNLHSVVNSSNHHLYESVGKMKRSNNDRPYANATIYRKAENLIYGEDSLEGTVHLPIERCKNDANQSVTENVYAVPDTVNDKLDEYCFGDDSIDDGDNDYDNGAFASLGKVCYPEDINVEFDRKGCDSEMVDVPLDDTWEDLNSELDHYCFNTSSEGESLHNTSADSKDLNKFDPESKVPDKTFKKTNIMK